jgi:hypothetical protein
VELDLLTCSSSAFYNAVAKFREWSNNQPPVGELPIKPGWANITWLIAQEALRRNASNRALVFNHVKKLFWDMLHGDWKPTGQAVVFNVLGKLNDGQHRLLACYFGKLEFRTFVVTDAPADEELFPYYDAGRGRSAADAIQTSGFDDTYAKEIAMAVLIAYRVDHGLIGFMKQPRFRPLTPREILAYATSRPSFRESAHIVMTTFGQAVSVIGNKGVAIYFADKAIERFGHDVLDDFYVKLGNGTDMEGNDLAPDDPVHSLRVRYQAESNDKPKKERVLALLIKAFEFYLQGKKVKPTAKGFYMADHADFPPFPVRPGSVEAEIAAQVAAGE